MNTQHSLIADSSRHHAVVLDWYAEDDVVKVLPRNQQRFEIHKDRAIKLLQLASHAESQLEFLLTRLASWIEAHQSNVETAYLTLRDDRFAFLAISRSPACDDKLEDAISDLDYELANDPDLDLIRLNALILPPTSDEALGSFLDDRFMLEYCGHRS